MDNKRMEKKAVLKKYFGYDAFRPGQEEIIDHILAGNDIMAVMPTGAGKSLCYQIPAMMLPGMTIVISPLISLMKDQVMQLVKAGIPAAFLNSSLSMGQYRKALTRLRQGEFKILYVAPERLLLETFLEICSNLEISMVAVDEAHCISQWGQDFRPDYLKILDFVQQQKVRPILASFTATATKEVKNDIKRILMLQNPFEITTGFDRPNLSFQVIREKNKDNELLKLVAQHQDEYGIIYCATRKNVEAVTSLLSERGYKVARYHAGLSNEERKQTQEDFVYDRIFIIVATNAFGMGIDKPNVSFVIHYNMPKSMEAYYQEAGRAGRDGRPSDCILLYSPQDVEVQRYMIEHSGDENGEMSEEEKERQKTKDLRRLYGMKEYCTSMSCLRSQILTYFGEESVERCDNCSNCLTEFEEVNITLEAQKIISAIVRTGQRFGRNRIIDLLKGSQNKGITGAGLDQNPCFGIMKEISREDIDENIHSLVEQGYLHSKGLEYPVLKLSRRGFEAITNRESIYMRTARIKKTQVHEVKYKQDERELYEQLRLKRRELAKEEQIPAFVIFPDATLMEMAQKKPRALEQMADIRGVGEQKLVKYAPAFLEVIENYLSV